MREGLASPQCTQPLDYWAPAGGGWCSHPGGTLTSPTPTETLHPHKVMLMGLLEGFFHPPKIFPTATLHFTDHPLHIILLIFPMDSLRCVLHADDRG